MSEFSGKVALVTGSSSGIGEAIARSLHALGASVVINSSSSVEAGQKIAESLGDNSMYVQADISDKDACLRLIDETLKRFGK
jgi:ketoreductase RED2